MNTAERREPAVGAAYAANVRRWQAEMARLARLAGVDRSEVEAECREIIRRVSGQESSKGLDARGWMALFVWLDEQARKYTATSPQPLSHEGRGEVPDRKKAAPLARGYGADLLSSPAQRYALETLRQLNEMGGDDFRAFCRDKYGFEVPATRGQANKVINALKPMALRSHQVRERVGRALDRSDLDERDRALLADVLARFGKGKQGSRVRIGSIPICLKILGRYGIDRTSRAIDAE